MVQQSFMPFFAPFGWLAVMLLAGVILRAKVGFFQRFLFPAALIGGLIGFIGKSAGWCDIPHETFVSFAIHLFTISFISIGLTGTDEAAAGHSGSMRKSIVRGMLWMACIYVAIIAIQGLVGGAAIFLSNLMTGKPIWPGLGMLVGTGFAQGPGQTVALAAVWEHSYHIKDAVSIGLCFVAIGFFIASLVGVPLANWGVRKGLTTAKTGALSRDILKGLNPRKMGEPAGKLTTHSSSADGLAFQLSVVLAVYLLTYFECLLMEFLLPESVKALAFGLMFLWGMFTAIIIRWILGKMDLTDYLDNNVQRRITSVSVDFMIIATLTGVKVTAIWGNIVPILLVSLTAGLITVSFVLYFGRRLDEYGFERMLAIFGTATGTGASGLMLLRIVDPDFTSPAAAELGLYNAFALVLLPLTLVIFPLPQMNVSILFVVLTGYALAAVAGLKLFGFWKARCW
ncbi:MAG TPA: sodium/glutamate symporter [Desulfotignum sp.]|nr:sodium/glutamate symporter [Desulfotignum sp.]